MQPIICGCRSLKGKASIVNPVNKLFSLGYKVQQSFFVQEKKTHQDELGEQHETSLPLNPIQTGGGGFSNPPSGKIVITPTPKEL